MAIETSTIKSWKSPGPTILLEHLLKKHAHWNCAISVSMPALLAANRGGLTCQKALRRNDYLHLALCVLFFMSQRAVFGQVFSIRTVAFFELFKQK